MKSFILLISLCFFSCTKKQQVEQLNRNNQLQIFTYGGINSPQFRASFNITEDTKDTLFVSKFNGEKEHSLKIIKLSSNEIDTLFSYFQKIKDNFKLNNRETHVMDGTSVRISISDDTNSLIYSYRGLDQADSADLEIGKLIKFINRRLPKDFQMY